jgi:hypothetical protein
MLFIAKQAALFESKLEQGDRFIKALNDPQLTPAASAERWLAASGAAAPGAASGKTTDKPGLLCLDARRRLVRCRVRARKSGK